MMKELNIADSEYVSSSLSRSLFITRIRKHERILVNQIYFVHIPLLMLMWCDVIRKSKRWLCSEQMKFINMVPWLRRECFHKFI